MSREQLDALTWENFKEELYDKYIPRSYRKAKEVEFYNLKQGRMTVTEYDRALCDMSRYAPEQVNTDEKMAEKFCAGLRHEIRMALACRGRLSYAESLSRALDVEEAMPQEKTAAPTTPVPPTPQQQSSREKRKWDGNRGSSDNKRHQLAPNSSHYKEGQTVLYQEGEYRPRTPQCANCLRFHMGECRVGRNVCYKCGGVGHISKECPNNNNSGKGARQNQLGQRLQLHALQAEPREDHVPPQHRRQPHGHNKAAWEVEDNVEDN